MSQSVPDNLFDQPYLICDPHDHGDKIKAICVFIGVEVTEEFIVGPIKVRPLADEDNFPSGTRFDYQHSVLELNYIDRTIGRSMYVEPTWVQVAAFKAIQLLVDSWSGISRIYHFNQDNEQVGVSGSNRYETADTQAAGILEVTDENKRLFKKIFYAAQGALQHAINRYSTACAELKQESILDFVISLEATLGYKLDTEIAHRLSCRGALLLAPDPSQREQYYRVLKILYTLRSRIAHGSTATGKVSEAFVAAITTLGYWKGNWSNQPEEFKIRYIADVARQVTRQVLLAFVKKPELLSEDELLELELGILKST
jgi:Apea-like HEPN